MIIDSHAGDRDARDSQEGNPEAGGSEAGNATDLAVTLHFRPAVLSYAGAATIAGHLHTLLVSASAAPERPVCRLGLLTEAEYRQLTLDWNDTATSYPDGTTIDQLVTAQAGRTPGAVAVESDGPDAGVLTYAELSRHASQFAHLLRQHGARPGQPVGVFVHRSSPGWPLIPPT